MGETALEVNHVSIDYKNLMHMSMHQALLKKDVKRADIVRAVDDVSFSVEKGKILGIVGRNGSGKTTLLRSIAGIFRPDEGWIDTKGNRVSLMAIGIGFNPNNTGRENILKSGMLLGCSLDYVKAHMEEIRIYMRGHNMFDCFYGRFKKEENELLRRYVALAPREEFADILDAIDRFVYFESRKV